jgi:3-oxoacyl-[acyl-carrier protein] reductase
VWEKKMDLGISDKTAIVTGAGGGIGESIARTLADEGVSVVIADINGDAAVSVAEDIQAKGGKAAGFQSDVSNADSVQALVDFTVETFGGVHILVNNAGIVKDAYLVNMSEEQWDAVLDVNLKGPWLLSRAVGKIFMEQKWGRVINIASRAIYGNKGQANYASSKAGLTGLTGVLSIEFGKSNVTANTVAPGFILTDMVKSAKGFEYYKERAEGFCRTERLGEPEDVADAVAFLASNRSGYITGETIHVTGGRVTA